MITVLSFFIFLYWRKKKSEAEDEKVDKNEMYEIYDEYYNEQNCRVVDNNDYYQK